MAVRPWVMPDDVREYTDHKTVKQRSDAKLRVDIMRGEQQVIRYTRRHFEDFEEIPAPVRVAVIIFAEAYALDAREQRKGVKSETFDDYSYTLQDGAISTRIDLAPLLDEFVLPAPRGNVTMRMSRL